ncbi:MAG: phosphodiesterase [Sphingosinicella sp.]
MSAMLIAQVTDLHLGFDPGNPEELNRQRLDSVLAELVAMTPRPDLLLATGDIANDDDDGNSYACYRDAIAGLPFPVFSLLGNHDSRAPFLELFPEAAGEGGFVQHALDDWPLRILLLDTLETGRHGGGFCESRAGWLQARLDEAPERPTLIALHHPPLRTGHSWMTEVPEAKWVLRLRSVIEGRNNIVALIGGHIHRPIITRWAGAILIVCSSTAPQVALDLATLDPEAPDQRPMIVAESPAYALHLWDGAALITHFGAAGDQPVLARFTAGMQPLLRMLAREKEEARQASREG